MAQPKHDVDVEQLPPEYKKQVLYNINRGVLKTRDREGLKTLAGAIQPFTPVPLEQIPIKYQEVAKRSAAPVTDPMVADLKPLRALLRQTIPTIKKEAAVYGVSRLRKLLELEKGGKKRKGIVQFLTEQLEKHELDVVSMLGQVKETSFHQQDPFAKSTQVSDIVESEEETVVFSADDVKEDREGGSLLDQEVLYSIDEV